MKPNIRELLILKKYRVIYEVFETRVEVLAFVHGAQDFAKWQKSLTDDAG